MEASRPAFDAQQAQSSIADTLGGPEVTQVFLHGYTSQPNLASLARYTSGWDRFPERALLLARPHDIVCVTDPVEPEYQTFLADLGLGVASDRILVVNEDGRHGAEVPLAQQLASNAAARSRLRGLLAGQSEVVLNNYIFAEPEESLAGLLRQELGRPIHSLGGSHPVIEMINQKHFVRALAQALGIPVAQGVIVELQPQDSGVDCGPLEKAIRDHLPHTGRVIVRGTCGASGSSTIVIEDYELSVRRALRQVTQQRDNHVYLVDAMVAFEHSPNVGIFIDPHDGSSRCISVADQRLDENCHHLGNVFPSRATMLKEMIDASYTLGGWLSQRGVTGYVGFDFCEYRDSGTGDTKFFLAEVNPRVNGTTYSKGLTDILNARHGVRIEAFLTTKIATEAKSFAGLRGLYGHLLYDVKSGQGILPYNTGCLPFGQCTVATLGRSMAEVEAIYEAFQEALAREEPAIAEGATVRYVRAA